MRLCSEKVSDESKITPRLCVEFVGVIVTLEGIRRVGSETLESCWGRPMSKNSVLDLLKERRTSKLRKDTSGEIEVKNVSYSGRSICRYCFRIDVGMGSRSQKVLDDWYMSLQSSSLETGVKTVRLGWMWRGWRWGEVLVERNWIVQWSLSTLL